MKVLVIDDDRRFQLIAEHKLTKRGFKVLISDNVNATTVLQKEKVDAVLMISKSDDEELLTYVRSMENPPLFHYFGPESKDGLSLV